MSREPSHDQAEALTVKWVKGYSFAELGRERQMSANSVRRMIQAHVEKILVINDRLEGRNA